ncbi:MAG TPA: hypothetical protein VGJ06_09805 [Candidatus Acidoferrum sp.]|jgi:hypothetical protein
MTLHAAMVLTTVGDPALLDGYFENFRANGRLAQVRVIVIPDRKTPKTAYERCAALAKKGLSVICPTLEEQDCFLRKLGLPADFIPYDSDNRRNIGYLIALEGDCDFVISIDDDNFAPTRGDYFGEHAVVCGETSDFRILEASGGWFNVCSLLNMEPEIATYPRGFPYFARHEKVRIAARVASASVRINGGLWIQHPDLDAMTWLNGAVKATAFRGTSFVLDRATWAPINSQNTAVHRSVIPSYYFLRMGATVAGMKIDRYGDIFSGYFSQACARALGNSVRVGSPIATHARNSHNYLRDATQEMACICVLEDLLPWLHEVSLRGEDYADLYCSLAEQLECAVEKFKGFIWTDETRAYFHASAGMMRKWAEVCQTIGV